MKDTLVYILLGIALVLGILNMVLYFTDQNQNQNTVSVTGGVQADTLVTTVPQDSGISIQLAPRDTLLGQYSYMGIDISHWDGDIDWSQLKKSGLGFVFMKATEGSSWVDPKFDTNWKNAKDHHYYRGAYHFFKPGVDPKAQARNFLNTVGYEKGDLIPVLDIEVSGNQSKADLSAAIRTYLETISAEIGTNPIIYTDPGWWDSHITGSFSEYPLWVANWERSQEPELPNGWTKWAFWQFTNSATVKGIPATKVDMDVFKGNEFDLSTYMLD